MEIHEIAKLIVFTEQDLSDDILGNLIELPNFTQLLHKKPSLRAVIENNLKDISRESKARIQHSQASAKITDEALQFSKVSNLSPTHFMANIEAIVSCIPNDSPFYNQAHKLISLINHNNAEIQMKLFMLKWKESLSKQLISEELVLAEKEREDIEREIQKRLKIANIVCDTIEISSPGRLWNLSKSILIHDRFFDTSSLNYQPPNHSSSLIYQQIPPQKKSKFFKIYVVICRHALYNKNKLF